MIKFDLDIIIGDIASALDTTYVKVEKYPYSKEYILPNVDKEDLVAYGFVYKGLTTSTLMPMYEYENLVAYFDYQQLHIYQILD